MGISLTVEQEAWISEQVARGDFRSVQDAVRQLIDERIAERDAETQDDLGWAKPYVDAALAEVDRGEAISHDEHDARMEARLAQLRD